MKKKTSPKKENKEDLSEEEQELENLKLVTRLSNMGEAVYQILLKLTEMNELKRKEIELLEKRNQLVEDSIEYENTDDESEDED